jgi:hypothetical protein
MIVQRVKNIEGDPAARPAVIASEAKQSRLHPRRDSGLRRFARNDGDWRIGVAHSTTGTHRARLNFARPDQRATRCVGIGVQLEYARCTNAANGMLRLA